MAYNALTGEGGSYKSFNSGLSRLVNDYVQRDVATYRGMGFDIPDIENINLQFTNENYSFNYSLGGKDYQVSGGIETIARSSFTTLPKNLIESYGYSGYQTITYAFEESITHSIKSWLYSGTNVQQDENLGKVLEKFPGLESDVILTTKYQNPPKVVSVDNSKEGSITSLSNKVEGKVQDTLAALRRWDYFEYDFEALVSRHKEVPEFATAIDSTIKKANETIKEIKGRLGVRDKVNPHSEFGRIYNDPNLNRMERANKVWNTIVNEVISSSDYNPRVPYVTPTLKTNPYMGILGITATYSPETHQVTVAEDLFSALIKGEELTPDEVSTLAHELRHSLQFWGMHPDELQHSKSAFDVQEKVKERTGLNMFSLGNLEGEQKLFVETALTHYELDSAKYTPLGRIVTSQVETDTFTFQYNWGKDVDRYERFYNKRYSSENLLKINPKTERPPSVEGSINNWSGFFEDRANLPFIKSEEESLYSYFLGTDPKDIDMKKARVRWTVEDKDKDHKSTVHPKKKEAKETSIIKGQERIGGPSLIPSMGEVGNTRGSDIIVPPITSSVSSNVSSNVSSGTSSYGTGRRKTRSSSLKIEDSTIKPLETESTIDRLIRELQELPISNTPSKPSLLNKPVEIDCPVCSRKGLKGNVCPNCKTDISLIRSLMELDEVDEEVSLTSKNIDKVEDSIYKSTSSEYGSGRRRKRSNTNKLDEVHSVVHIPTIQERQDIENRFRQTYVNQANKKGFNDIEVDVISSQYETKPYISSHQQSLDVESGFNFWDEKQFEERFKPRLNTSVNQPQLSNVEQNRIIFQKLERQRMTVPPSENAAKSAIRSLLDSDLAYYGIKYSQSKPVDWSLYDEVQAAEIRKMRDPARQKKNLEGLRAGYEKQYQYRLRVLDAQIASDVLEKGQWVGDFNIHEGEINYSRNTHSAWEERNRESKYMTPEARREHSKQLVRDRMTSIFGGYMEEEMEDGTIVYKPKALSAPSLPGKERKRVKSITQEEHIGYLNASINETRKQQKEFVNEFIQGINTSPSSPTNPRMEPYKPFSVPLGESSQKLLPPAGGTSSRWNKNITRPANQIMEENRVLVTPYRGKIKEPLMGGIGIAALTYIGIGVALRGPDYLSHVSSNITSFFTGLVSDSPYQQVIVPGGHRVIPELNKGPLMTTSRGNTYIEAYRVHDISIPSAAKEDNVVIKDTLINTGIGITLAIAGGVSGLLIDKSLSNFSKAMSEKNPVFKHVFDRDMTGAFGKNFSPLIIGALTGVLSTEGDMKGKLQSMYLGASVGSFIGFMSMKEEVGPLLHKKLGIGLMGIGAGLLIASNLIDRKDELKPISYSYSKDGSIRVTYDNLPELIEGGKGQLPSDFYQHPEAIDLARSYLKGNKDITNIFSVESSSGYYGDTPVIHDLNKDGGYNTRIGKLNINLDIKIPTYSKEEGFKRVSISDVRKRYSINKDKEEPIERAKGIFNAYQLGLFIPSMALFAIGLVAEAKGNEGIKKVINALTSYNDKLKYIWPGEREIGVGLSKSIGALPSFMKTGAISNIREGIGDITKGVKRKVVGEAFSLGRKALVYAIPLSIISSVFDTISRNRDLNIRMKEKEISHWESMEVIMPETTGIKDIDRLIESQRYMEEGTAYKIDDVIIYDSGTIGKGLRNFLEVSPDKSIKGLLYKLGHEEGLLEVMSRKAAYKGLGISGGENINPLAFLNDITELGEGEGSWAQVLSYPFRAAKYDGFSAGLNSLISPTVGGITNLLATNLGFNPIYKYKFDKEEYSPLAQLVNTSVYGGIGMVGGIYTQVLLNKGGNIPVKGRYIGAVVGALLGGGLGLSMPTYIDKGFYDSVLKQSQLSFGVFKEVQAHNALTGRYSGGPMDLIMGATLSISAPALIGALLPGTSKQRFTRAGLLSIAGYGIGMAISKSTDNGILPKYSPIARRFLNQQHDLTKQTFSVLSGSRRKEGTERLTHIHSKVLWSRDEVFISTGNLDTVWKGNFGDESQFNVAVRVRGEQAKSLINQLDKLHLFLKDVKPEDNLSEIALETPDLVLGGKGSGSDKKILDFIKSAKGDLWISAPYLSGVAKEVRPLVEAIKQLESKGQNVHLIAQNPRGVSAGGVPSLSIELQKELMDAGVDVYTAPYTDKSLAHAKILADDERAFITSHNIFSGNSMNQVVEVGIILQGKEYSDAVKQAALRFMINNNYSNLNDNSEFSPEVFYNTNIKERIKSLGIDERFSPLFLDSKDAGSLLLNPQMGASFFYSRALYNNLMRQAGYGSRALNYKDTGIATSLYNQAYLIAINKKSYVTRYQDLEHTPFLVRQYDKELLTQGLGGLFNEFIAMPLGLGRLYKDEVGFIPSLLGTIGAVLDKTYLYTTGRQVPGVSVREDVIGTDDQRYKDKSGSVGLFETLFTEGAFLAQQAASSVSFYMIMGEPLNLLISEGLKTQMEVAINKTLDPDISIFHNRTSKVSRSYTLGLRSTYSLTPMSTRLNLISDIDVYKSVGGFYSPYNMDLSSYHLTNLFIRERAAKLQNEVMKPFILDYINPYIRSDKQSQDGFRGVIDDVIEEFRRPISLEYELISRSSTSLNLIMKDRTLLMKSFSSLNTFDLSAEVISYKHLRHEVISIINTINPTSNLNNNSSLSDITKAIKKISNHQDEGIKNRFKEAIDNIDKSNTSLFTEYTSEGNLIKDIKFSISNVGQDRASIIAQKVQAVLDEIPLNPLRWGMFNKYKIVGMILNEWSPDKPYEGGYQRREIEGIIRPKVATIGDILSFSELTEITRDLLFGKGGISSFMAQHEVYNPSNDDNPALKRIALNASDKLESIWKMTIGFTGNAVKRVWDRYFLLMGTPFHNNGLLRSTDALKAMEYNLVNAQGIIEGTRGISWADDTALVKTKVKEIREEALGLWNELYTLIDNDEEVKAVESLRSKGRNTEILEDLLVRGNREEFINYYVSTYLPKEINPLARQLNTVDSSVVFAMQQIQAVDETIQAKGLGPRTHISIQEHLRSQMIGRFNVATLSGKQLAKRMIKIGGFDDGGAMKTKNRKSVFMNTIAWTLVTGSLFLESLFRNTSGVSLTTQLGLALTTGGGILSPLLGNKEGELNLSTDFVGTQLLPGSGAARYALGITLSAATLGLSHMVGVASLRESVIEYSIQSRLFKKILNKPQADGAFVDVLIKYKKSETEVAEVLLSELIDSTNGDWKGLNHIDIINRLKSSTLEIGENAYNLVSRSYIFGMNGNRLASIQAVVEGGQLVSKALTFRGNMWRNTAISYAILSLSGRAMVGTVANALNFLRDNTGSIDSIVFGGIGALLGFKRGGFSGAILGSFIGSSLSYIVNNVFDKRIFAIGSKGRKVENTKAQIVSELSNFRTRVIGNIDGSSRAELMGALWAGKIMSTATLLEPDRGDNTVKVQAKQIVLPFLQFYLVARTEGERTTRTGAISDPGQTSFHIGIQGPPISGMSMGISLPLKIIKGKGVFGLTANNDDYDVGDLMQDMAGITVAAHIVGTTLRVLDSGVTVGRKTFHKVLGSTVNAGSQVQRKSALGVVSRGFMELGNMIEDIGLILPNTVMRVGTSIPTVEYRLLKDIISPQHNIPIDKPKSIRLVSYMPKLLMGSFIGSVVGQIGGSIAGAILSQPDNYDIDKWSSMGIGVGILLPPIYQITSLGLATLPLTTKVRSHLDKTLMKIRPSPIPRTVSKLIGKGKIFGATFALGYFLSSSGSGVSIGMDADVSHQIGVASTYGLVMGTIATSIGGMGKGMSSTLETYNKITQDIDELNTLDGKNIDVFKRIRLTYQKFKVKSIKGDAEDVIAVLMNNKTEIDVRYDLSKGTTSEVKYKKLKDISDSIHGLDLGSAQEVLNSKTVKSLNIEDIKGSFLEGRFRNRVFAKRILRTLKVPIFAAMVGGIANAFNPNINVDSFLNGLEGRLENQKRFRAGLSEGKVSLEQRVRDVAADTFKLLFLKDRDVNSRVMLDKIMRSGDAFEGMNSQVSYSKLLNANRSTLSDLGNIYSEMSQLFVLDDTNAFLTLGVAGGSFRRKEYGTVMTPYVQIQSSGADISSAAYSMSSSFLFKNMMYGPNDLLFNVQNAMRFLNTQTQLGRGNDRRVLRLTAIRLLSGTAHLNPRTKARRVSTISQGVLSAITKDALLGSILKHRVSINKNLSFQPYESLISTLLKGQLNPSNPHLDRMMTNKLKGIDKGLDSLFMGDPFFLITRNFNIVDIKAFAKGKGEKDKEVKSISQQYQETDDIWTGMDSFYMTSYLPEDKSLFKDNPLVQLTNRLFSSLPGPIGFLGSISLLTLATFSIVSSLHSLNAKGETRILTKELGEYFNKDWFGRVGGEDSHVYVWRTTPARPLPGEGVYLRGSPPLLFKGSYQFQLNANFYSKNVRYAFNQIQEELNTLMFKGWGKPKTPVGSTPSIGTHVMDFLINQKEKHVQETLRTFDNLPQSFQDINESNNSFMFDRDKGIEHNLRELDKRLTDNSLDESFRKRLEEERLKLSTELDNISGVKGKELLVKRIVEVYSNELDGFVDNYLEILASRQVEVNNAYLAHMEDGTQLPGGKAKINVISLFATNASLEQLVEVSKQLDEDLDKGLKALVELMDDDHKKAFMVGDTPDIKLFLKSKARSQVEAAIKEYLKKLDNPQDIINFLSRLVKGDTLEITNMSIEVIGHLSGIKGDKKDSFFGRIRHHWGGLGKSPSSDNVRLLDKAIGAVSSWMRNMSLPNGESANPSMSSYTAHSFLIRHNHKGVNAEEILRSVNDDTYIDKIAKAQAMLSERETFTSKTLKTGGLLWEIYGVANDILEALNVFSAYGNLGQSYKNRNITEAQRLNYAYDAGMVTVNVGFSIGLMSLGVHVGMLGLSALTAGATSALLTVGLPFLAGAAVIGVGFLGYNLLPDKQKTQVKSAINNSYIATGNALKKAGDFSFDLGTRIGGESLGGVLASGTIGAMGGTIAGATLGVAIGTFSLVSAALIGTSLIGLGALGGMLLTGGLIGLGVGALLGMTGGSNVIDGWMDKLSKVKIGSNQIFRPFINRPGDWLRMSNIKTPFRGRSQYGSPLETLTVNEAIQKDYSSMLYAATDETGNSSASLFISPTVYGGNVGETNAHMQKYGSISIIRPGGVADPLLIKDISLRGQAFNQTIIGRYTWNKILSKSSNLRGIKAAMERYKRGNIEHQKIEKTINQARSIKNNIGDIKAETPKRRGLSKEGVSIAANILNIKDTYNEAQKAVNRKNIPLVAKVDMSNVRDYEREFRKDLNLAVRDVTLVNKDNIIRVVPTIDADVKEAVLNPIST